LEAAMTCADQFVVDWYLFDDAPPTDAAVMVFQGNKRLGLYQVKRVTPGAMILFHGDAPVPVGTRLDIDDFQSLISGALSSLVTTVTRNDYEGIHLAW
jgi:hypothetical protein